jgi:cbb3-type cytochrome oxidase subunit 1
MLLGLTGFFWALTGAGLAQASSWVSEGQQIVKAVEVLKPYFYLRSIFGTMIWVGGILQVINLYMTIRMPVRSAAYERIERLTNLHDHAPVAQVGSN